MLTIKELWRACEGGRYAKRRIPGMIVTNRGTLILYNEARLAANDWAPMDIFCQRSEDGGESFTRLFVLEDDPYSYFCYPAIFDGGDYILVSYYHSNRTEAVLSSCKTVKIMKNELREAPL